MINAFEEVYIVGKGSAPCACAELLARYSIAAKLLEITGKSSGFLRKRASAAGIELVAMTRNELAAIFKSKRRTLVLSVNNDFLFPAEFLENQNITVINYHNSLLPAFRGMNAEAWAIFTGCEKTGITWHMVNAGIDTGDILFQAEVKIDPDMTSVALLHTQAKLALEILENNIQSIMAGKFRLFKNERQPGSIYYKKDKPGGGALDISWPNEKIWNFLRAMDYGPYFNLGTPSINLGGKIWSWKKYRKLNSGPQTESIEISGDKINLRNAICLEGVYARLPERVMHPRLCRGCITHLNYR